ncbi:TetR/AcrR family transcriptional regulator C-terminal domain-containing protein [Nonomuraea sp. NPDC049709]|uniref:TetR/AcrR family transcriptional regulator n=1 Tax=Nonomuraea sp. NPDC049709 TaxID=3154736 RepID=UPI00343EE560
MGTARPTRLTAQQITDTALQLIDAHGLTGLTMRRLGAELGVEAMAIYRHFSGKEVLLQAVAARFGATLRSRMPTGVRGWDKVRHLARTLRQGLLDHPNLVPLLFDRPALFTAEWLESLDVQLSAYREAGLGAAASVQAYRTLGAYVLGYVTVELQFRRNPYHPEDAGPVLALLASGRFATLQDALPHLAADWDEVFELGLDTVITGIQAQLT